MVADCRVNVVSPKDLLPDLQGVVADWMQNLHEYHLRTEQSLSGGFPFPIFLRCPRRVWEPDGVLVSLDKFEPADPILADQRSCTAGPRGAAVLPHNESSLVSVPQSVQCNLELQILVIHLYDINSTRSFLWETPKCLVEDTTWARALWLSVTEEYFLERRSIAAGAAPSLHGRLTYESVMAEIEKEAGRDEIQLRSALRVPLPPAAVDELDFKPAFQSLARSSNTTDLMQAVVDIGKAIVAFDDPMLGFPALTPDRLLFKTDDPNTGFILDLDLLDEPTSITHCVPGRLLHRHAARSLRFAAYDRITPHIAPPPDTLHPRHALESLFNALVWVALCKGSSGAHIHTQWFSNARYNLPQDRTRYEYRQFVDQRREFLLDAKWFWNAARMEVEADIDRVVNSWLIPLWRMISEAHFFSRGREREEGYDWETLGGRFTVEGFVAVLQM